MTNKLSELHDARERALDRLRAESGTGFDVAVEAEYIRVMRVYEEEREKCAGI